MMRTRDEILAKIEEFEAARGLWIEQGDKELQIFTEGNLSAFYYVLKMKNPVTGYDMAKAA